MAKSDELLTQAAAGVRSAGASTWERIAQNPAPVALAAVAVGLLAVGGQASTSGTHSSTESDTSPVGIVDEVLTQALTAAEQVTGIAGSVGQQVTETVARTKDTVQSGTSLDRGQFQGVITAQPIMTGLVAIGLGLAVGLSLPQTAAERDSAGSLQKRVQDNLGDMELPTTATEFVDQAKAHLSEVTGQARTTATDGAEQAKQMAKDLAAGAKQTATESAQQHGFIGEGRQG